MPQEIKNTLDFKNVGKIVNLPDGVDPQDAATVHQLATGSGTAAWGGITGTLSSQTDLQAALDAKENIITAGSTSQYWRGDKTWQDFNSTVLSATLAGISIAGGAVTSSDGVLTAFGKLQNQINGVLGGATYQGVWNASSNTPSLAAGTGTKGYYYVVSVNGSTNLDGITDWKVGDWAIFNGTTWDKVDNTDAVSSVNGAIGAISLAGTANRISVSGTTFDIASTYAGQSSINTVGTIATGVWNGTAIGSTYGGTGLTTYAKGDVLIATGTNVLGVVSAASTDGYIFTWDAASGLPMWKAASGGGGGGIYAGTGTAFTSYAKGDLIYASAANVLSKLPIDSDYKVLTAIGGVPVWSASGVSWSRIGNAGTVAGTDFLGTTDDVDFVIKRNSVEMFRVKGNGSISMGALASATPVNTLSFGSSAGSGFTNVNGQSNFFGNLAGQSATNAYEANFFGTAAGRSAPSASYSNFYGYRAGDGATNASESNFFGQGAGQGSTGAGQSNFFGSNAGQGATGAKYSNFFGYNVGFDAITGQNNILIGLNITTPATTSANMFSFGNVLYGFNTYSQPSFGRSRVAQANGKISVGTNAPAGCAILDLTSTTMAFLPPRMTTTQKTSIASPAEGLVLYDNVLHKLCVYTGSAWETITSA